MNNLKNLRNQCRLTLADLASRAGFASPSRVSNYESGLRNPGLEDCRSLTRALADAGALNERGEPVTLDDVFPPESAADGEAA